ncbi:hypothetical protein CLOM_g21597 [Closterium sp. NIES-68]|nr:hypothetical protein CLOM_g21597 [Closterium sp. NIES-68]
MICQLDSRRADLRTTESSWNHAPNRRYSANFGSANQIWKNYSSSWINFLQKDFSGPARHHTPPRYCSRRRRMEDSECVSTTVRSTGSPSSRVTRSREPTSFSTSFAKIKTIQERKLPSNIKELQSFLGFVNYIRKFIANMTELSAPLTDRLKDHDCFWWGEKQQAAFDQLKITLTSPLVLRIASPDHPYEVINDASDIAIGAVLLQDFGEELQPVAYESRKLQGAEKNYTVHDKEMLAIVHAFQTWRHY